MRSAVLVLLTLHLHAATALLALRLAPPPLHRPVEVRLARAAGIACMVEDPEALLVGDKWTEAGFESIQGIMGVCKRTNMPAPLPGVYTRAPSGPGAPPGPPGPWARGSHFTKVRIPAPN